MSDETVNDVNVEESAGSTGLLDDNNDVGSESDFSSTHDDSVSFSDDDIETPPTSSTSTNFDPLSHEIDDEELKTDGFYDGITEHDIKELPTVARRMLHNFRVAYKQKSNELDKTYQSRLSEYKKREQQIEHLERDFARRQAEFAALVEDPGIQEALKVEEGELPDIMSEDGMNAHINRRVAEAVQNVFAPMQQASSQRRQEAAFYDFLEAHPEMKDSSFKKEVAALVTERKNTDAPLSTQDAYEVVKARKIMAEQRARVDKERRARADAARRVQRSSMSGSPDAMQIPPEVKKQGAASIAAWLKSNPEAAKALSNYR